MRFNLLILILFVFNFSNAGSIAQVVDALKNKTEKLLERTEKILNDTGNIMDDDKSNVAKRGAGIISEPWKKNFKESFEENVDFLQQIIINGEEEKDELKEFNILFDELREWVDSTLLNAKYKYGPGYSELMKKKNAIQVLVDAQKNINKIIDKKSKHIGFDKKLAPQIKLFALYNLNALLQKTDGEIATDEIEEIVDASIKEVVKSHKELAVGLVVLKNLVSRLKKVKAELILQDEILFKLEKLIKNKFIDKEKRILGIELLMKRQAEIARRKSEDQFKGKLKEIKKGSLDLELKIKKDEKDVQLKLETKFQERLAEIKKILTDKQRSNIELQFLLKQTRRECDRLRKKAKNLKRELITDTLSKKSESEEEQEFKKNAVDTGDKRLAELFEDIDTVSRELEDKKSLNEK